jgi:hypothetical protein
LAKEFKLYNTQLEYRTGKFLKLEIESFYGTGGGLQYFTVNGKNAPTGNKICIRTINQFCTTDLRYYADAV